MPKNARRIFGLVACLVIAALFIASVPSVSAQNEPPVADANGPYSAPEGMEITFNASGSEDPDGDALQYRWDFHNDGIWDTEYSPDPTATHTWFDDYWGVVMVIVTDGELNDTAIANVTVFNVEPIPDGGEDRTVEEGELILFQGSFYDPGFMDIFTVAWVFDENDHQSCGDKIPPQLTLDNVEYSSVVLHTTLKANDFDVNDLHLKALNGDIISVESDGNPLPVGDPNYFEHTFVPDISAGSSTSVNITVEPEIITVNGEEIGLYRIQWDLTYEDDVLNVGLFSNETEDTSLPFWKGFGDDCGIPFHTVNYTVMDDDGGIGYHTIEIIVQNVAPTVDVGLDQTVNKGDIVYFDGSFTDPGWLDSHTITWDFGDGETAEDTLAPTHTYASTGNYTVILSVVDDDGGSGNDTLIVTVKEKQPGWDIRIVVGVLTIAIVIAVFLVYRLRMKRT